MWIHIIMPYILIHDYMVLLIYFGLRLLLRTHLSITKTDNLGELQSHHRYLMNFLHILQRRQAGKHITALMLGQRRHYTLFMGEGDLSRMFR